jgi:alpha-tubulin suppressor-like RCC1 family protein
MTGFVAIAAGGSHVTARRSDATIWVWGLGVDGQLGFGNTYLTSPASPSITNVSFTAGGVRHTVVAKADGTVWDWGSNSSGQLGDGTTANSTNPVQVRDPLDLW